MSSCCSSQTLAESSIEESELQNSPRLDLTLYQVRESSPESSDLDCGESCGTCSVASTASSSEDSSSHSDDAKEASPKTKTVLGIYALKCRGIGGFSDSMPWAETFCFDDLDLLFTLVDRVYPTEVLMESADLNPPDPPPRLRFFL
ncbi:hypothetical protein AB1L42_18385 [Thalassoglobus sp. JC818]|uniref:hypothetical protein n=1 Tax=Thalassoglobus sp. JC818 TaxID=3232136 RepID=UPI003457D380